MFYQNDLYTFLQYIETSVTEDVGTQSYYRVCVDYRSVPGYDYKWWFIVFNDTFNTISDISWRSYDYKFCICEWAWHAFCICEWAWHEFCICEWAWHEFVFLYLVIFTWDDDDVLFVQEYQSMGRHVTSLRHIIMIPSQQVLAVALNTARLNREAAHVNIIVHGLIWPRLEHTIYHRGGEHANHFTTDFIILYLKSTTWIYCYFL